MDIDKFYSENPPEVWEKVLGPGMHYHYRGEKVLEEILEFIPPNSKVLDCGCGWGGTGRFLMERGHDVTGVTISKAQAEYIKDFPVIHADLHDFIPEETYDVAVMVECYFHLSDPRKVFDNLVPYVKHLIIVDVDCPEIYEVPEFGIKIGPREYIFGNLWKVGYVVQKFYEKVDYYQETREQWKEGLKSLAASELTGHLEKLNYLCHFEGHDLTRRDPKQIIIHAKRR